MRRCRTAWCKRKKRRSSRFDRSAGKFSFTVKKTKESVMNAVGKWCVILSLAATVAAQTSTPPKAKKTKPATITAADVQALKDAIASQQAALAQQQQQIQELRDELHRKDQAVTQAQTTASDAASKADAAQAQASQQEQAFMSL